MADVKWIKIVTNIFDNRKVVQIEHMPEGDGIIVIWLKLLCLAGEINDGGQVYLTNEIPYTDQLLANAFRRPLNLIQLALATFEQFGMIEVIDDIIQVSNWEKYQNVDAMEKIREQNRERQKRFYDRRKQEAIEQKNNSDVSLTLGLTQPNATDKEKEEDKEYIVPKGTPVQEANFEVDDDPELEQMLSDVKKAAFRSILTKQQQGRFIKFWEMYPKKVGKQNAEKAWRKINPSEEETNNILLGLKRSIEKDSRFREQQFTPMPASWLNAGGWEDEFQDELPDHIEYKAKPTHPAKEGSFDAEEFLQSAIRRTLEKHENK